MSSGASSSSPRRDTAATLQPPPERSPVSASVPASRRSSVASTATSNTTARTRTTTRTASSSRQQGRPRPRPAPVDTVGSLLADIANLLSEGIRALNLADKRLWGLDEVEQLRALEGGLDEARKDFQELSPLVHGQMLYEADCTYDSIRELRELRDRHTELVDRLRAWTRTGGPIEASWALATQRLQRELHLAQCRAARRIFVSGQESSGPAAHCLGAFLVRREQVRRRGGSAVGVERAEYQRRHLEELRACRRVGGFQRFGDVDMAFVCDFCDGHLVWGDVERVPSAPTTHDSSPSPWPAPPVDGPSPPTSPTDNANTSTAYFGAAAAAAGGAAGVTHQQPQQLQQESWQATTYSMTRHREKQVVFAPLAIANHVPPHPGDWLARLTCPFCEDEAARPVDVDEDDEAWRPGDAVFEDLEALQEHLEWYHVPRAASGKGVADSCAVM